MKIPSWTVAALVLALPAGAPAQGLGDASKKEQARRKQAQQQGTKAKTYSEADLQGLPPIANGADAAQPAASDVAPPPAAKSASGSGEERVRQQDEQRWRSRVAAANARLEAAQKAYDTLSSMVLVPGYVYEDAAGRTVIGSVEQLQGMTARAKAERDSAQKALDDLLEEARRQNVPPGGLR
jgi:hypothetical protein